MNDDSKARAVWSLLDIFFVQFYHKEYYDVAALSLLFVCTERTKRCLSHGIFNVYNQYLSDI